MKERTIRLGTTAILTAAFLVVPIAVASAQQSFEEWQAQQNQAFEQFLSREDAAFAEFLATEWEQFQSFLETGFYDRPKLDDPPRIDVVTRPDRAPRRPITSDIPAERDRTRDDPIAPNTVSVSFYGIDLDIPAEGGMREATLSEVTPDGFSTYWETAASADGGLLAETVRDAADRAGLNDYDRLRVIVLLADHLYERDRDRAAAIWFLMVKNGYDMRIAYSGTTVALLMPSANTLYQTAYFTFDGNRYYILGPDGTPFRSQQQWRTYASPFPGSTSEVHLELPDAVGVSERMRLERLDFTYRGTEYTIEVPVNENIVEYLAEYPYTDWWVHFFPPTSSRTRQILVQELGRLVEGRTPAEAANLLIRFVQTAFPYQTDQEHFGFEKWQAPEEILFYRRSDCDDRSILYAFLLREVLGWDDVAMLIYPGHLAVAVPQRRVGVSGDSVRVNGETYIVTDPTYIGADIGMAMPQFRNVVPETHVLRRR